MDDPSVTNYGDVCRICRSEGSESEPLFYPCKCNGSIKFVHQACLMEWLSHSQKKYCELCKTPFKFTKMYSTDMPRTLPTTIYLKQICVYLARWGVFAMRGGLVVNVWLCWVPYLMRRLWTFLFWVSDVGLDNTHMSWGSEISDVELREFAIIDRFATCPASPLMTWSQCPPVAQISPFVFETAIAGAKYGSYSEMMSPTIRERFFFNILRFLFPGSANKGELLAFSLGSVTPPGTSGTLLSHVEWLRNLTAYPHLNYAIIRVLEGQFITILVVIGFILIILVRDYVIQHQPAVQEIPAFRPAAPAPAPAQPEPNVQDDQPIQFQLRPREDEPLHEEPFEVDDNDIHDNGDAELNLEPPEQTEFLAALIDRRGTPSPSDSDDNHNFNSASTPDGSPLGHPPSTSDGNNTMTLIDDDNVQRTWSEDHETNHIFRHPMLQEYTPQSWNRYVKSHRFRMECYAEAFGSGRLDLSALEPSKRKVVSVCAEAYNALTVWGDGFTTSHPAMAIIDQHYRIGYSPVTQQNFDTYTCLLIEHDGSFERIMASLERHPFVYHIDPALYDCIDRKLHQLYGDGRDLAVMALGGLSGKSNPDPSAAASAGSSELGESRRFHQLDEEDKLPEKGQQVTTSGRPRSLSDGPLGRSNLAQLGNGSWTLDEPNVGPSGSNYDDLPTLPSNEPTVDTNDNSEVKNAHTSNRSFSALESQPLFARTRDDEDAPFMNSSPTAPDSSHADAVDLDRRVMESVTGEDVTGHADHNSDWESVSDDHDEHYQQPRGLPGDSPVILFDGEQTRVFEPVDHIEHVEDVQFDQDEDHITWVAPDEPELFNPDPYPFAPRQHLGGEPDPEHNDELPVERVEEAGIEVVPVEPDVAAAPVAEPEHGNLPAIWAEFMWGGLEDVEAANNNAEADDAGVDDNEGGVADAWRDIVVEWNNEEAEDAMAEFEPEDEREALDNEDIDGLLELLGMVGPITGLFQNAMFCISITILSLLLYVVVPYNVGRITSWFLANPLRFIRISISCISFAQDLCLTMVGAATCLLSTPMYFIAKVAGWDKTAADTEVILAKTWDMSTGSVSRFLEFFLISQGPSELMGFTAASHLSVITIKQFIGRAIVWSFMLIPNTFTVAWSVLCSLVTVQLWDIPHAYNMTKSLVPSTEFIQNISLPDLNSLIDPDRWIIKLDFGDVSMTPLDKKLMYWSASDRILAIFIGYITLIALSMVYLKRRPSVIPRLFGHDTDELLADVLHQAGGVLKVLLVISIEMLLFPLYCGILMDVALLPLFEGHTLASRLAFTAANPTTSIFVHWFVGTGYMFHFALFVSMCRKIMRKGVLYFIRDPDDPDFHPIREVLERNFFTQLRKIGFSAMVYGTLIIMCLGGVVWSLMYWSVDLFPIHYSSNEPVLEFPVDLLFYNFFMPLAVKFFKPGKVIHQMYRFCFRKSAALLRLTWYVFGERRLEEEGVLLDKETGKPMPLHKSMFVRYSRQGRPVMLSLSDYMRVPRGPTEANAFPLASVDYKRRAVENGELAPDGRFVYAPSSDQVRLVKGRSVFVPVAETDILKKFDPPSEFANNPNQFQLIYLPPNFYLRVTGFVLLIWIFAAVTGVTMTVIPLYVGRMFFKYLLPDHVRTNDIYAFTIGVYTLASILWLARWTRKNASQLGTALANLRVRIVAAAGGTDGLVHLPFKILKLVYTYTVLFVAFPIIIALLVELYLIIPMHTWLYPSADISNRHVLPIIQIWTIGILMLKLITRHLSQRYANQRLGRAMTAVFAKGALRPRVGLFTRAFALPVFFITTIALTAPYMMAKLMIASKVFTPESNDTVGRAYIFRWAFPVTALWVVLMYVSVWSFGVISQWKREIRDEVYCVGARLHNHGEHKATGRGRPVEVHPGEVHLVA